MAPTLMRLVVVGVQKNPVSSQTPTSHLWARGQQHAVREGEKWKECKFVPFKCSPEKWKEIEPADHNLGGRVVLVM